MELQTISTIMSAFIFAHVFTFTEDLFLQKALIYHLPPSFPMTPSSISCRTGLLVSNSLIFCLYGTVLLLPSFWRAGLVDTNFLCDAFLPTLYIPSPAFLATMVSDEKSGHKLLRVLWLWWVAPLTAFKILLLFFCLWMV